MRFDRWFILIAGALLAVAPRIASAEDSDAAGSGGGQGWNAATPTGLFTPLGEYFLLGGGVSDFADGSTKDRFGVGGSWDARIGIGSRSYVGGELAYVGSARAGDGTVPDLTANGVEGVLRLQYPYSTGTWRIEPFAFGGIGWSHLALDHAAAAGLASSDDVGVVPFGGGVTLGYGRFLLDARFTYRASFDEDLRLGANEGAAKLSQWAAGASVGYEF